MINPMRAQPTRMMGLASGMDTDFIIQQTLRMHQFKIDNSMRNKKLIEWRQQIHSGIKDEISKLRNTFLSNLGSKSMMNRNVFNATSATVSGSNSSAVSIWTHAGTPLGNFKIDSVTRLAQGAHLTTNKGASADGNGFSTTAKLGELNFGSGMGALTWTRVGGTVRVGNEDIKIERQNGDTELTFKNAKGEDITDQVAWEGNKVTITTGGAGGATRTLNWDAVNDRFTEDVANVFTGGVVGDDGEGGTKTFNITAAFANGGWQVTSGEGSVSFKPGEGGEKDRMIVTFEGKEYDLGEWDGDTKTVGGTTLGPMQRQVMTLAKEADLTFNTGKGDVNVQIRETDSLHEMLTRVNNSAAGVTMGYDRLTDQFTLESKLSQDADPSTSTLGIYSDSNFFNVIRGGASGPIIGAGQKALMSINGETVESNTNRFDYRGVGITINHTFSGEAINVNLARDTEPAMKAIKEFIDSYNAIISRLEGLLTDRKGKNEAGYKPLTDEEKQGMTEKQIDEWEAIAKKGLLRNDQGIQSLVSNLRSSFFSEIEGMGISPSQIGLTTGPYRDGTGGQIIINEERLKEALERDPDMVADVFIKIDGSGSTSRGVGLLHKIDGLMRDYVNESQSVSIKNLEDSLKRANDQIAKMQERMFAEEDRLYRQFAAMESAMSKLQQQGDWFGAMLGGK